MKRIFTFLLLLSFTSFMSMAQTLKIIKPGGTHALNDSTISYSGNSTTEQVSVLYVINTSATIDTILVRRHYISVLGSTTNAMCWAGFCYDTTHNISDNSFIIGPGDTALLANQFSGDYYPNGQVGTSTFMYIFYDLKRPVISDTIIVKYQTTPTGISSLSDNSVSFSAPYPNPSNSQVNFNYSFANAVSSANLKVFNLLGECVETLPLNPLKNMATINVQSIPTGIYICEVQVAGSLPVYQKMVVSH